MEAKNQHFPTTIMSVQGRPVELFQKVRSGPQEEVDCSVALYDPLAQHIVDKISCIQFLLGLYIRSDSIRWCQDAEN